MKLPLKAYDNQFSKSSMEHLTLSVLLHNYSEHRFAIAEAFIDTMMYDNDYSKNVCSYLPHYFSTIPCFRSTTVHNDIAQLLFSPENIVNVFKDALGNGYYVCYILDTFYCKSYFATYNTLHQEHLVLINGFDDEKHIFYGRDSFNFKYYSDSVISYDEIENTIRNFVIEPNLGLDCSGNSDRIQFIKLDSKLKRDVNLDLVRNKLKQFLNSDSLGDNRNIYYGIVMFDIIAKRMRESGFFSIKNFSFIQIHIYLMQLRAQIIGEKTGYDLNQQIDHLKQLEIYSHIIQGKCIKYKVKHGNQIVSDVLLELSSMVIKLKEEYKTVIIKIMEACTCPPI